MKFVIDMNLSPNWVEFLELNNFEAVHWSSVGAIDAPDWEIMEWARKQQAIVFTHDLDFSALLATSNATRPSVLQVRDNDVLPESIGIVVMNAIETSRELLESGALVLIEVKRFRVRILPLKTN